MMTRSWSCSRRQILGVFEERYQASRHREAHGSDVSGRVDRHESPRRQAIGRGANLTVRGETNHAAHTTRVTTDGLRQPVVNLS
jgi:hypothetical protein